MANEPKKLPAHEVILEILREHKTSWRNGVEDGWYRARARHDADALLKVLRRMHIPKSDRPRVIEELHQFSRTMYDGLDLTIDEITRSE